jgi:hypothetical protein
MTNRQKIEALYIDWVNNFLTVPRFAEYYGLTEEQAHRVINTGRALNHRRPTLSDHWTRLRTLYPAIEKTSK